MFYRVSNGGSTLQFTSSFSVSQKDGQSGIRLTCVVASGITGLTNPIIAFSNLAYTNNTSSSNNTIYNGDYASGTYDSSTGNITITSQQIHKTNYTITMSGVVYLIG